MTVNEDKGAKKAAEVQQEPRFSVGYMDRSANPREEFFKYATGEWMRTHPIPSDRTSWGSNEELIEWNLALLRKIAEECAADGTSLRGSYARMVGDFYTSAMNTDRIESLKFAPIDGLWQKISAVGSVADFMRTVAELHSSGVSALFSPYSEADSKNSTTYAFYLYQGGLSLPDREYYVSDTKEMKQTREDFLAHVTKMFMLKGMPEGQARQWAGTVLDMETEMARASRNRTEIQDPKKNYNAMSGAELDGKYANLALTQYMKEIGVPQVPYVVVGQPEFLEALNGQLARRSLDEWKVYLYWHALHANASLLHGAVVDEDFDFYGKKLMGQEEQKPRWKRAVGAVDSEIGEALGKLYVDRHFDEESRRKVREMVDDVKSALKDVIDSAAWMSDDARKEALEKLSSMRAKIGYPDKFRDYTGLDIRPDDYVGNVQRADAFEFRRITSRVGKPVDENEWGMTPPTVNAYYSPERNEIVLPAGTLQPPFFDKTMDAAVNYAGTGASIIGHEIIHGFDSNGRYYDAKGNLRDWWTADDEKRYDAKAAPISRLYGSQEALPGMFIKGEQTLGEDIADMGGVDIAYRALQKKLGRDPSERKVVDGFTQEQRFYIAFAQAWRGSIREEMLRVLLVEDVHSPYKYRGSCRS